MQSEVNTKCEIDLSIIVPCYKTEKYLPKCLDSLLAQTKSNIEVICINDGSPDSCLEILQGYKKRFEGRLVILNKPNEGAWRGRRDGIAIARGKYIGFVDSDDYVAPTFCDKLYNCAIENNADIAVCGFHRVNSDTGRIISEEMAQKRSAFQICEEPQRLLELNGAPWNKLYRSRLLKEIPDISNPPAVFEDIMMNLLTYINADKIAFTPNSLIYYVIHNNSLMTTIGEGKISSTYSAMLDVKKIYIEHNNQRLLNFLDAAAFLHLGISLPFRLSYDKTINFAKMLKENAKFLDSNFPSWRSNEIISRKNARRYKGALKKLWIAKWIYTNNLMDPALRCYRFLIDKMGIEIKW